MRFDQMLSDAAIQEGAIIVNSKINQAEYNIESHCWRLQAKKGEIEFVNAEIVVDATGRSSWLAHKQGIQKVYYDRLVGVSGLMAQADGGDFDSMTLIEAVPDGWWYSALIPGNQRVTTFFTDSDIPIVRSATTARGWIKLVGNTEYIRLALEKHRYRLILEPYTMMSNSARLKSMIGTNWVAVGDAAASFDPLSSEGILTALESAIKVSHAILDHYRGKANALYNYAEEIGKMFGQYLEKRCAYYNKERRWIDSIFWKRSHKKTEA
jgi:flavin-dependent dehydrogenase